MLSAGILLLVIFLSISDAQGAQMSVNSTPRRRLLSLTAKAHAYRSDGRGSIRGQAITH